MIEVVEALSLLKDVVLFSPAPICGEGAILLLLLWPPCDFANGAV